MIVFLLSKIGLESDLVAVFLAEGVGLIVVAGVDVVVVVVVVVVSAAPAT